MKKVSIVMALIIIMLSYKPALTKNYAIHVITPDQLVMITVPCNGKKCGAALSILEGLIKLQKNYTIKNCIAITATTSEYMYQRNGIAVYTSALLVFIEPKNKPD